MKKLFDETHESEARFYRTVWYGYVEGNLDDALQEDIVSIVKADLAQKADNPPTATHWIFYGGATNKDAIGDTVRASLMIRERGGNFVCHYNMSDFDFVMAFDMVEAFKSRLEKQLNE
ncbi:hypothetical protein [Listeria booriae]|uniref:hypothetical protein n=1 Tax=Listeria booriae TaxID=1552123 RepID=UPI001626DE40|nr:hypothetical protein [Listeria booriae]MBC2392126.1 hypothetical protein [Listeria booriae]